MSTDTRRVVFDFVGRDNVSKTTQQVGREIEGLNGRVGKLGGMMGGALKTGAIAGAAGLAAMGGAAIAFGVKTAASMEQAQVAFTTMLGSAGKAKAFLGELQKFAAATPFELPQLTRASQRLLAFGFSAKEVIPTLTAIGDAVAGLGGSAEQIDQVTTAIGQMMAKGKIQSDELLQLTEAGVPALKILANQFHKSTGEMQNMVTKGLVPSSKAIPLLLKGIENGTKGAAGQTTKFAGMMKNQSSTLAGMWSTLKDNVSQALGNMITPFMPALKSGLTSLVGLTSKLSAGVSVLGKSASKAGKDFMAGFNFGGRTGETLRSVSKLREFGSQVGAAWVKVSGIMKRDVIPALKNLAMWWRDKILPVAEKLHKTVLKELGNQLSRIGSELAKHKDTWMKFAKNLGDVVAIVNKYLSPVLGFLAKVLLKELGDSIVFTIKMWKALADHFNAAVGIIRKGATVIGQWWSRISAGAKRMRDLAASTFLSMTKVFLTMVSRLISGAARAFGWVPGLGPKLRAAAKNVEDFKNRTNAAIDAIRKSRTVKMNVDATGHWHMAGVQFAGGGIPGLTRAQGGPVPALWAGASEAYDSQPALLRVNEHVWTPEEVRGAGGHSQIMKLRQMARKGLLKGFAGGGPVGMDIAVSTPTSAQMSKSVWGPINAGTAAMIAQLAKVAVALTKAFGSASGVVAAARSQIGRPYSWGGGGRGGPSYGIGRGAHTFGFDCSGLTEYAWWKGAHVGIGGVTDTQWANSRPISGPRPGALGFPHGPSVHVMLASDKPGYVIQAPFTGSYVQEVRRSASMWRWPTGARYAAGGMVRKLGRDFVMGFAGPEGRSFARLGGIAGSRADGGPVFPGGAYLVGERGPEVIVPRQKGDVYRSGSRVEIHHHHYEIKVPPTVDKGAIGREIEEARREFKRRGGKLVTP